MLVAMVAVVSCEPAAREAGDVGSRRWRRNSCQQRGVQSQTFQCTFNAADGPQSLIVVPEAGEKVPHKKAEIEFFASKCVANCALPPPNPSSSAERVNP